MDLLKRRCRSILMPYILWNTLALLVWQSVNMTFLGAYTSGGYEFVSIRQFFYDVYISPILVPLWFLRNLMVFIVLLPLLTRLLRVSALLLMTVAVIIDMHTPLAGILYYSSGLVLSRHRDMTPHFFRYPYALGVLYSLIVLYSVISGSDVFGRPVLGEVVTFVGLFAFWKISQDIRLLRDLDIPPSLVFFMYAFHGIVSPYVVKGMALFIPWHGGYWLLDYAAVYLIVVTFSYMTYHAMSRFMPRMLSVLTGQRERGLKLSAGC